MNAPTKTSIPYIRTANGLTVVLKGRPYSIAKDDKCYDELVQGLRDGKPEDDLLTVINHAVAALQVATQITPDIKVAGGVVYYKNAAVHNSLTERMLKMLDEGFDLAPMANFMANLMENPSYRAVNELYSFLEKGKMPITPDGYFMAYKAVREDYTDIHSGTFDNSVGKICEMSRNSVDEDRDRTCSTGLHFCSFDYLPHFAHADGHVMLLKINPKDVVSIPSDYNDTKGRCCRYEVVGEYEGYYDEKGPYFTSMIFDPNSNTGHTVSAAKNDDYTLYGFLDGDETELGTFTTEQDAIGAISRHRSDFESFVVRDEDDNDVYECDGDYQAEEYVVKGDGVEQDRFDDLGDAKHAAVDLTDNFNEVTVEDNTGTVVLRLA